jgi:hypothetical protein
VPKRLERLRRLAKKGKISEQTLARAERRATRRQRAKKTRGRRGVAVDREGVTVDIGRPEIGPRLEVGRPEIAYEHDVEVGKPQIGRAPITLSEMDIPVEVSRPTRGQKIARQLRRGGRGILRAADRLLPDIAGDTARPQGRLLADLGGEYPGRVFQEESGKRFFVPQYGPLAGEPIEVRPGQSLEEIQDFALGPPGQRGVAPAARQPPPQGPQAVAAPPTPAAPVAGQPTAMTTPQLPIIGSLAAAAPPQLGAQAPLGAVPGWAPGGQAAGTVGPLQGASPEQQALAAALAARRA